MKLTLECTTAEFKELGLSKLLQTIEPEIKMEENELLEIKNLNLAYWEDYIQFCHNGKAITIAKHNLWADEDNGFGEYFTFDEVEKLNAGKSVKVNWKKYKLEKWWHIPTIEERQELAELRCEARGFVYDDEHKWIYSSGNDIDRIWEHFAGDFLLPFAGYRSYNNASLYDQGSYGYYWSSSPLSASSSNARYLYLNSSNVYANYSYYRAHGISVRCFKDL